MDLKFGRLHVSMWVEEKEEESISKEEMSKTLDGLVLDSRVKERILKGLYGD